MGRVDELCVERGVGLVDFVFLFFLEQIEVETLLHFLFTLHGDKVFGLFGVGREFAAHFTIESLEGFQLYVYRIDLVGDGGEDVFAYILQFFLLLADEGVLC